MGYYSYIYLEIFCEVIDCLTGIQAGSIWILENIERGLNGYKKKTRRKLQRYLMPNQVCDTDPTKIYSVIKDAAL